jgi:hypothetical protein
MITADTLARWQPKTRQNGCLAMEPSSPGGIGPGPVTRMLSHVGIDSETF